MNNQDTTTSPNFLVFTGRSNPPLKEEMVAYLNTKYNQNFGGRVDIWNFEDGEIGLKFMDNVRGKIVAIVQPTNSTGETDSILELLIMIDAAKRASADKVFGVIPCFGYAQQDRKPEPRVSIAAKLMANLLEKAGANRIITMDLHAPQIQGFFDIPVDHVYSSAIFIPVIQELHIPDLVVVSPDAGANKLARFYARRLGATLLRVDKARTGLNKTEVLNIEGDYEGRNKLVEGMNMLIVDDQINTAGTLVNAANALHERHAKSIIAACPHLLLAGNANARIDSSHLTKVYGTNSVMQNGTISSKIEKLSIAQFLGEVTYRSANNLSITSLYEDADELKR